MEIKLAYPPIYYEALFLAMCSFTEKPVEWSYSVNLTVNLTGN